jgi:sterol desaturase/sphingolipid hydroxylase (fatty acid hydroxylase superfamily)
MDAIVRLSIFFGVLLLMVGWEYMRPKRQSRYTRAQRWPANLGIVVIDTLLARLLVPAGVVGVAMYAGEQGWGLFNLLVWPAWLHIVISIIVLDVVIYWQHRAFHYYPMLWRLHRMHHADPDFDVTTGLRFHPLEILLSLVIKGVAVLIIGAPVMAVIIFEVVLNACSMFNHANVALPPRVERWVRKILITQELHRIHHSTVKHETNSNYGFSVSWWDHLFFSYTDKPQAGSDNVDIGLDNLRDQNLTTKLYGLLRIPFK